MLDAALLPVSYPVQGSSEGQVVIAGKKYPVKPSFDGERIVGPCLTPLDE